MTSKARNPFVGPRPFTRTDPLFGRKRETAEVVDLLLSERLVLLHAPSGAGKTSLLQAGVLPELERQGFRVLPVLRVGLATTAERARSPNRYIESALTALDSAADTGAAGAATLAERVESLPPLGDEQPGAVLVFDQFEEILSLDAGDEAVKRAFFADVSRVLSRKERVWAIFAIREDYLGALRPYQAMVPTRLRATYRLGLLAREEAREAIVMPAGEGFFADELVNALLSELSRVRVLGAGGAASEHTGAAIEPVLLQVVCLREWDRIAEGKQDEAGQTLVTRVDDALAKYYSEAVARAANEPTVERALRRWVDDALVIRGKVRGQAMMPDEPEVPAAAVTALLNAYVLRKDERRGVVWLELSHDRLIPAVHDDNARWFAANLQPFQTQASVWEQRGRQADYLLRGEALRVAEKWVNAHEKQVLAMELAFVTGSRVAARAAARTRQLATLGVVFLCVVTALAVGFSIQARKAALARAQKEFAEAERELAEAERQRAEAERESAEAGREYAESERDSEKSKRRAVESRGDDLDECRHDLADRTGVMKEISRHVARTALADAIEGWLKSAYENYEAACKLSCTEDIKSVQNNIITSKLVFEYNKERDEAGRIEMRKAVLRDICGAPYMTLESRHRERIKNRLAYYGMDIPCAQGRPLPPKK